MASAVLARLRPAYGVFGAALARSRVPRIHACASVVSRDEGYELVTRQRLAEQVALTVVAAQRDEVTPLRLALDSLGDELLKETALRLSSD